MTRSILLLAAAALACAPSPSGPRARVPATHPSRLSASVTAPNGYDADTIAVGGTTQLTESLVTHGHKVRTVVWTSRDTHVATVTQAGLVTGVGAGATFVAASNGQSSDSARITVTDTTTPPPPPPPPSCALVTDWNAHAQQALANPAYMASVVDPAFGTTITRVTGDPGTATGVGGTWPAITHHQYSKVQPWSADMKYLYVRGQFGTSSTLFLDGATYQPLLLRSLYGTEQRWHPTVPDIMIYVAANGTVGTWNPFTNVVTPEYATTAYSNALMGSYEGNPSRDGRYVAVLANRNGDGKLVVYVVDRTADTKSADVDLAAEGVSSLDWASVSQGGGYLVLHGVISGLSQSSKIYDRATLALISFWQDNPLGHFDLGFDVAGNEVVFGGASSGTYNNRFLTRRLDNGVVTAQSPALSYDWHASTRAYTRPGWGYAVINNRLGSVLDGEIFALKLDGSQGIERFAHDRSTGGGDRAPIAVPSPDGRRVMFASDWGNATGPVSAYVVDTRPLCPNGLP